jgi:hypothetical protein
LSPWGIGGYSVYAARKSEEKQNMEAIKAKANSFVEVLS